MSLKRNGLCEAVRDGGEHQVGLTRQGSCQRDGLTEGGNGVENQSHPPPIESRAVVQRSTNLVGPLEKREDCQGAKKKSAAVPEFGNPADAAAAALRDGPTASRRAIGEPLVVLRVLRALLGHRSPLSVRTLGRMARCSRASVYRCVANLRDSGGLPVEEHQTSEGLCWKIDRQAVTRHPGESLREADA